MSVIINRKVLNTLKLVCTKAIKNLYPKVRLYDERFFDNKVIIDVAVNNIDIDSLKIEPSRIIHECEDIQRKTYSIEVSNINSFEARKYFESIGEKYREEKIYNAKQNSYTIVNLGGFRDIIDEPIISKLNEVKDKSFLLKKIYSIDKNEEFMTLRFIFLVFNNNSEKYKFIEKNDNYEKYNHLRLNKRLTLFKHGYQEGLYTPYLMETPSYFIRKLSDYVRKEYVKAKFDEVIFLQKPSIKVFNELMSNELYSYKEFPIRKFIFKSVISKKIPTNHIKDLLNTNIKIYDNAFSIVAQEEIQNELFFYLSISASILRKLSLGWRIRLLHSQIHLKELDLRSLVSSVNNFAQMNSVKFIVEKSSKDLNGVTLEIIVLNNLSKEETVFSKMIYYGGAESIRYVSSKNKVLKAHVLNYSVIKDYLKIFVYTIEGNEGILPIYFCYKHVTLIPFNSSNLTYVLEIQKELERVGVISLIDKNFETSLGKRISQSMKKEIPYVGIVGENEIKTNTINVKIRNNISLGIMSIEEFKERIVLDLKI